MSTDINEQVLAEVQLKIWICHTTGRSNIRRVELGTPFSTCE